jgi:hypothetical protein
MCTNKKTRALFYGLTLPEFATYSVVLTTKEKMPVLIAMFVYVMGLSSKPIAHGLLIYGQGYTWPSDWLLS